MNDSAPALLPAVALRKESVDRNQSPIPLDPAHIYVALRKESVDRNPGFAKFAYGRIVALRKESVDRNSVKKRLDGLEGRVALRKESVDRNILSPKLAPCEARRSPQGERG